MSEPVLLGLLFADKIITEDNGKKGIIGTFNNFQAQTFPIMFPSWCIFASVTNLQGKHSFSLNLVHNDTSQVVLPINGEIETKDFSEVVELVPTIMGAVFPKEGKYTLTFNIDGQQIGSRILEVNLLKTTGVQ